MSINRLNYEEFMADYLEGNLDPILSAELMVFLSDNPDLEKQFCELEPGFHRIPAETLQFPFKETLRKDFADVETIYESNFDEFCIAEIEGMLKKEDKKKLLLYIDQHPQKAIDYEIFRKTLLKPDPSLHFPGKDDLKKTVPIWFRSRFTESVIRIAAASAVILLIIAINPGERSVSTQTTGLVINTDAAPKKEGQDNKEIGVEKNIAIKSRRVAMTEKKLVPVREVRETIIDLPELHNIPSSILPNPDLEYPPVEKTLFNPSQITESTELLASLPESKNSGNDIPDLLTLVQRINIWKTAGKIVDGVNVITESQIQLFSAVNDQGKLTDIVILSEAFSFESRRKK
jgi:hypothetical protein